MRSLHERTTSAVPSKQRALRPWAGAQPPAPHNQRTSAPSAPAACRACHAATEAASAAWRGCTAAAWPPAAWSSTPTLKSEEASQMSSAEAHPTRASSATTLQSEGGCALCSLCTKLPGASGTRAGSPLGRRVTAARAASYTTTTLAPATRSTCCAPAASAPGGRTCRPTRAAGRACPSPPPHRPERPQCGARPAAAARGARGGVDACARARCPCHAPSPPHPAHLHRAQTMGDHQHSAPLHRAVQRLLRPTTAST